MILIADDNSQVRRMIRELIEDIDSQIIECEDGGGAIAAYEQHHPDFVLMDVHMTPVDGLTASKEILHRYPDAKIIAVTQYQDTVPAKQRCPWGGRLQADDLMSLRHCFAKQVCPGSAGSS